MTRTRPVPLEVPPVVSSGLTGPGWWPFRATGWAAEGDAIALRFRPTVQTRSKAIATDPPPPRQRVARPYCPPRRWSSWSRVATIRAPDAPIG